MTTLANLNNFWFGSGSLDDPEYMANRMRIWFGKDPDFDQTVAREFQTLLAEPPSTRNDHDVLARVILFDQVPRNAYRGDSRMFAFDNIALDDACDAIEGGVHERLHPFEATFLYLPFEHSENVEDQDESVRLFTDLQKRIPPTLAKFGSSVLDFAQRHREIVKRFGRFPHRNGILGRGSSANEVEFLKQPGSGF